MSFDAKKFPMLGDPSNQPTCPECGAELVRSDFWNVWYCPDLIDCDDCTMLTDAEMDNRLQSLAEAAFERQQERGTGEGFLSPDAMQRGLKR